MNAPERVRLDLTGLAEDEGAPIWIDARARYGRLATLVRFINLERGTDEVKPLSACDDHSELHLDGCCLIVRAEPDKPQRP
jgi:hypothetical protein